MADPADQTSSLLDVIRRKEAEVTRCLAAASRAAEADIAAARQRAQELITQAEVEGEREGQRQRQMALDQAEREAETIIASARAEAETLRCINQAQMEEAVRRALEIIIGEMPNEGEKP
jgi:vacuolar-type H+-ATPase subunit H